MEKPKFIEEKVMINGYRCIVYSERNDEMIETEDRFQQYMIPKDKYGNECVSKIYYDKMCCIVGDFLGWTALKFLSLEETKYLKLPVIDNYVEVVKKIEEEEEFIRQKELRESIKKREEEFKQKENNKEIKEKVNEENLIKE